jgi:hypothetical protein
MPRQLTKVGKHINVRFEITQASDYRGYLSAVPWSLGADTETDGENNGGCPYWRPPAVDLQLPCGHCC